jgi:hypothetical protein
MTRSSNPNCSPPHSFLATTGGRHLFTMRHALCGAFKDFAGPAITVNYGGIEAALALHIVNVQNDDGGRGRN